MIHEPSDEEAMIRASVAQFVRREAPPDRLARLRQGGGWFDPGLYAAAARLGWFGITLPEAYGGMGLSVQACAVAFEELGRAPLMGPLFTSGVLAGAVLAACPVSDGRDALLRAVASGDELVALAVTDSMSRWAARSVVARLSPVADGFLLDAVKPFVHDGESATSFLCAARMPAPDDGIALFAVPRDQAGVTVEPHAGLPAGLASVTLHDVRVRETDLLAPPGDGWPLLERATLRALPLLCAFIAGACQEIYAFTVEYSRQRSAFGQLIGRFQRVQDHVVELVIQSDAASLATAALVGRLEAGLASPAEIHQAAAIAIDAYYQACNYAHMVHAGPGTDLDHPLMGHTIASRALYQILGTPDEHKQRMMDLRFPIGD
jgi:alkylation response protein AidB-like acyl-CoA dehydrogenase